MKGLLTISSIHQIIGLFWQINHGKPVGRGRQFLGCRRHTEIFTIHYHINMPYTLPTNLDFKRINCFKRIVKNNYFVGNDIVMHILVKMVWHYQSGTNITKSALGRVNRKTLLGVFLDSKRCSSIFQIYSSSVCFKLRSLHLYKNATSPSEKLAQLFHQHYRVFGRWDVYISF